MSFKVGDWVRISGTIQKVIDINPANDYNITADIIETEDDYVSAEVVELWQPKEGEWCWFFTDKMQLDNVGILRKFTQMESDIEDNDMFGCEPTVSDKEEFESIKVFYKYCEPFIGQLPIFLKENK